MEERAIDRLRAFIAWLIEEKREKTIRSFETHCGLSANYINNAGKSRGAIGSDIIAKAAKAHPELDVRWLCTGEGDMIVTEMLLEDEDARKQLAKLRKALQRISDIASHVN